MNRSQRVVGTMADAEAIAAELVDAQHVAEHAIQKAEALEMQLEQIYAHLPGFLKFCDDLARTHINPIARRARTQANTLKLLLPPSENDNEGDE